MGFFKMAVGTLVFIIGFVILMQPIITIIDSTSGFITTASTTDKYAYDTNGSYVYIGHANAAGDIVPALLYGIGFFMVIGFIVWLVMRAPNEPDYPTPEQQAYGGPYQ